jgi:hypothetical protein
LSLAFEPMKPFILLDGLRGIYVPQKFAQLEGVSGIVAEDLEILRAGPDHEFYLEVWDDALRDASLSIAGNCYSLHQSEAGDLWAVPSDWEVNPDGSFRAPESDTLRRYTLPASWACYLANGDESEDGEGDEIEAFLEAEGLRLWTFSDCGESFFGRPDSGGLRGDVAEFTFTLIR